MPIARPEITREATIRVTPCAQSGFRSAPSAMRMPISPVLRFTEYKPLARTDRPTQARKHSQECKGARQARHDALLKKRLLDLLGLCAHTKDGQFVVNRREDGANWFDDFAGLWWFATRSVRCSSDERQKHQGANLAAQASVSGVTDDAHDEKPRLWAFGQASVALSVTDVEPN